MNTQSIGPTGSGKTTGSISKFSASTVLIDPHSGKQSLAFKAAQHGIANDIPLVFDDLARTDLVLQWEWLEPMDGHTFEAELFREEQIRGFADVLIRERGMETLSRTPLIEEGIVTVLEAWLKNPSVPLYELYRVFDTNDPVFSAIEDERLQTWRSMTPSRLRQEFGAAERIFRRVLRTPAFRARCGNDWGFVDWLNNGGSIIVQGGDVDRTSMRITLGAVLQKLLWAARQSRFTRPIHIMIDEAGQLIGGYEANGVAELRKYGVSFSFISQDGDYGLWTEQIWSNCNRTEVYGVNSPDVARKIARLMKTVTIDPYEIHDYRDTERQFHDGYDDDTNQSQYVRKTESQRIYRSLNDQLRMFESELMNLKLGERYVKQGNRVHKEHFEEFTTYPWGLEEYYTWEAINEWIGVLGVDPSNNFSQYTPQRSPRSKKSADSPRTKQPHGAWRQWSSENESEPAGE